MKWFLILFVLPLALNSQQNVDTLRVGVYNSPPFGMSAPNGKPGGLMVDLWEDIAKENDWYYTYVLTDLGTVLKGLQDKSFDVGLGAISITPKREAIVDFSQAVNPSGTGIAVAKNSVKDSFLERWGPILLNLAKLIAALLLILLLSACIVWLAERKHVKNKNDDRSIKTISDGLWWSAVTMTTVGYGDKVPHSKIGKILGIIWIFTSIIFFSLFTAHASAELASSEKKTAISKLDDLRSVKVIAVKGSSGEEFLIRERIDYVSVDNIHEAITKVINNEADAVVSNIPVLKYHSKINFHNQLLISKEWLLRNNMGIALVENSPIREKIDISLLQKISEAKWQNAVYKYIGD